MRARGANSLNYKVIAGFALLYDLIALENFWSISLSITFDERNSLRDRRDTMFNFLLSRMLSGRYRNQARAFCAAFIRRNLILIGGTFVNFG